MVDPAIVDAVERVAVVFERRHVSHCLIGGLAVGLHSRPRSTKDADFIVHVPALQFPGLLDDLVADGFEIDLIPTIRRWSSDRLLVFYRGQARIDWMQPVLPIYQAVLDSSKQQAWAGTHVNVASPAGLILTKLLSFRPQDQVDIQSLIESRADIDVEMIRREWAIYADGEPARTAWLNAALAKLPPNP